MSSIRQRLDKVLTGWRDWNITLQAMPQVISELKGGITNTSFLLSEGRQQMVLRLNSPYSRELGIDRDIERKILELVSPKNLAPKVYFNNLDCLVTEYLAGDVADYDKDHLQCHYQQLLQAVHQLTPDLPEFNYLQHMENYWCYLVDHGDSLPEELCQQRARLLPVLEKLGCGEENRVLCHHDPGLHNLRFRQNSLLLIDWEYAGMGMKAMDYAASGMIEPVLPDFSALSAYQNRLWHRVFALAHQGKC